MAIPAMAEVYELGIARVKVDDHGVFFFDSPLPREYRAVSYVPPENIEKRLLGVTEVVEPDPDYLKIPVGLDGLRKAARDVVGARESIVEKVTALRKHFLSGAFRYTLTPPNPPPGRDVYDWFVTEGRAGYCTHYAGALTLMCRAVGVPARVATGLHVGKEAWDPFNKRYIAKNSDAHAWTEVWFGREFGWIPFDATPPEGVAPANTGAPVATGDGAKGDGPKPPEAEPARWDEAILAYDSSLQGRALVSFGGWISAVAGAVFGFLAKPVVIGVVLAAVVVVIVVWTFLPRAGRATLRRLLGVSQEKSSVDFYAEFLWLCSKKGLRKSPGMTGAEFAGLASLKLPASAVEFVTKLFYRVRYGGRAVSGDERLQLDQVLRQIETHQPPSPAG
jgi:hypothetical protein